MPRVNQNQPTSYFQSGCIQNKPHPILVCTSSHLLFLWGNCSKLSSYFELLTKLVACRSLCWLYGHSEESEEVQDHVCNILTGQNWHEQILPFEMECKELCSSLTRPSLYGVFHNSQSLALSLVTSDIQGVHTCQVLVGSRWPQLEVLSHSCKDRVALGVSALKDCEGNMFWDLGRQCLVQGKKFQFLGAVELRRSSPIQLSESVLVFSSSRTARRLQPLCLMMVAWTSSRKMWVFGLSLSLLTHLPLWPHPSWEPTVTLIFFLRWAVELE